MSMSDRVLSKITERFGGKVLSTGINLGEPFAVVEGRAIRDVLAFLKVEEDLSYTMLVELFGVDCQEDPRFEVIYILRSMKDNGRITVKAQCGEEIDTVSDLWAAADWFEREAYDMFGIRFKNHPNLRRIYNDDDFVGFPLRKDFPLEGVDFDKPFVVRFEEEEA
jgi:NADH-quinone oxidoreductase subunit C